MGRGGDKVASPKAAATKTFDVAATAKPWESLPTEELRKKAQQFGHDASADRETLLRELVRRCAPTWMDRGYPPISPGYTHAYVYVRRDDGDVYGRVRERERGASADSLSSHRLTESQPALPPY